MCTLGGFFLKNKNDFKVNLNLIKTILNHIDLRGRDAFGAYNLNKNEKFVTYSKEKLYNYVLYNIKDSYRMFFIGRAIPATERIETINIYNDTQPFFENDTVVTHNGLISNDKELIKTYKLENKSNVDSSIIPLLFNRFGVEKTIDELLVGSYAIASCFDKDLYLITNYMPLYYYEDDYFIYWFSDPIVFKNLNYKKLDYYSYFKYSFDNDFSEQRMFNSRNSLDFEKVAVICSGGLDSVTTVALYYYFGYNVNLIHFNYGQKAQEAEDFITDKVAEYYNIPKFKFNVTDLFQKYTTPSVLLGNKHIDFNRLYDAESTASYVGCRNAIFTMLSLSFCEKMGIGTIALGLNIDDSVYADNNITYLREFTELTKVSMNTNNFVCIEAPFVHLTKKEIIEVAKSINAPLHLNVSCYYPELKNGEVIACGNCGCDKLRVESFKALGLVDPVKYKINQGFSKEKNIPLKNLHYYLSYLYIPSLNYVDFQKEKRYDKLLSTMGKKFTKVIRRKRY